MRKLPAFPLPQQKGFTLVEVLLAITLMSMLLALAYGGLRAAIKTTESGQELLEASGNVRVTHQFIRRQLNQMQPLPYNIENDAEETRVVFEGDSQRIQYVAPMPGYLGQGGPQVQYIELVRGTDGIELIFSHQLLQGYDPAFMIEREPIILLEGIERAEFEFLARDENGELLGWSGNWDTPGTLPVAVRLDVDFGEDSRSIWPLLMAAVKVDELATSQ
ncbi:MAG: general secretion pathway protein J, partial [Lysobacterales bacterium]